MLPQTTFFPKRVGSATASINSGYILEGTLKNKRNPQNLTNQTVEFSFATNHYSLVS